jgi:hypothetical protein
MAYDVYRFAKKELKKEVMVTKEFKKEVDTKSVDDLKLEYEKLTGEKPHHRMGEAKLVEQIEKLKEDG